MNGLPFEILVCEVINDFPEEWIQGPLTNCNRKIRVPMSAFEGRDYSLFCKIEKGCIFSC